MTLDVDHLMLLPAMIDAMADVAAHDFLAGAGAAVSTWCRPRHEIAREAAGRAPPRPVKLAHWITGLSVGGAEFMLYRVLQNADRARFAPSVTSLQPGSIAARIEALGIPVSSLGMRSRMPGAGALLKLWRVSRALRPDVLQGWMYHGNLAATASWCLLGRRPPLVWGIHHSVLDLAAETWPARMGVRMNALLSHLPDAIVYVSHEGARQHEQLGFPAAKTVVIPNGFDCAVMKPDGEAPARLRAELGIPPARAIVGMVTRAHPMKDHANLIRAVGILVGQGVDVHLVMMGRGVDPPDGSIAREVALSGLRDRVTLLGQRDDVQPVLAGLDVLVVSSAWGESFPLIVGDAMASGVPCVVTNIGDCPVLVGDTGIVVPRRDSAALAAGIERLIVLGPEARRRLGMAARARIQDTYSVERTTQQYEQLYQTLIEQELATPMATSDRAVASSIGSGASPGD